MGGEWLLIAKQWWLFTWEYMCRFCTVVAVGMWTCVCSLHGLLLGHVYVNVRNTMGYSEMVNIMDSSKCGKTEG